MVASASIANRIEASRLVASKLRRDFDYPGRGQLALQQIAHSNDAFLSPAFAEMRALAHITAAVAVSAGVAAPEWHRVVESPAVFAHSGPTSIRIVVSEAGWGAE